MSFKLKAIEINMEEEFEILRAMRESILFIMYPDIWTKYKYGGMVKTRDGRLMYVWKPIKKD